MPRGVLLGLLATMMLSSTPAAAQPRDKAPETASAPARSCDEFLPARQQTGDRSIGSPDACRIVSEEIVFNLKGQHFLRLEMRISGTVEGFAVKQGARSEYFNDAPDFVYGQAGRQARDSRASAATAPRPGMACRCSSRSTRAIGMASCS